MSLLEYIFTYVSYSQPFIYFSNIERFAVWFKTGLHVVKKPKRELNAWKSSAAQRDYIFVK